MKEYILCILQHYKDDNNHEFRNIHISIMLNPLTTNVPNI